MKTLSKILCIDDHYINGAIIQGIFKDIYDVSVALTGQDALNKIEQENFNLILLDIGLPDMSGYTIANILNQKKIPFIFLTAKISKIDIEKGYEYRPLDYMKKPINGTEIKFQITKHINILQIEDENKQKIQKLKDDILSIFTHEMNTPLNTILSFSTYIIPF